MLTVTKYWLLNPGKGCDQNILDITHIPHLELAYLSWIRLFWMSNIWPRKLHISVTTFWVTKVDMDSRHGRKRSGNVEQSPVYVVSVKLRKGMPAGLPVSANTGRIKTGNKAAASACLLFTKWRSASCTLDAVHLELTSFMGLAR